MKNDNKRTWEENYLLARDYYIKNGNLDIPQSFSVTIDENNIVKLGNWLKEQRKLFKKGNLSIQKIKLLENIGMKWNILNSKWEDYFSLAKDYFYKHKNLSIPRTYIVKVGDSNELINLGEWIINQRKMFKKKKLQEDRINKLESIGISWEPHEYKWEMYFNLAKNYYEENHHLNIPGSYIIKVENGDKEIQLGKWLIVQRSEYKKGILSEDRQRKLESIGIKWEVSTTTWENYFKLAQKYYEEHHHLNISKRQKITKETGEEISLGNWIFIQRRKYKKGQLTEEQIKLLESIGIKWNILLDWEDYIELAKNYYQENGNLNIPVKYQVTNETKEDINLGIWLSNVKQAYKRGQLNMERIKELEDIGIKWGIRKRNLNDNRVLCQQYNLDFQRYPDLLKMPYDVLNAKINYLKENSIPLIKRNNNLNDIFFMSDINMQVVYGISLETLINEYSSLIKRGEK